jgi:hypothetical protein
VVQALTAAFLVATLLVLAIDALLHLSLSAVRIGDGGPSWWEAGRLAERAAWVVMALLLRTGTRLTPVAAPAMSRAQGLQLVGGAMVIVPLAWALSTLVIFAIRMTWRGTWPIEGRVLVEPYYYSTLVLTNAPWMLAGAVLLVAARHVDRELEPGAGR